MESPTTEMNEGVDIAPVVILDKTKQKNQKCIRGKPYVPLDLVGGMYSTTCKAVARSEQDPSILTEGHPLQPSASHSEGDTWALSSLPCPPGIFQAFLSQ